MGLGSPRPVLFTVGGTQACVRVSGSLNAVGVEQWVAQERDGVGRTHDAGGREGERERAQQTTARQQAPVVKIDTVVTVRSPAPRRHRIAHASRRLQKQFLFL